MGSDDNVVVPPAVTAQVSAIEKALRALFGFARGVVLGVWKSLEAAGRTFVNTILAEIHKELDV